MERSGIPAKYEPQCNQSAVGTLLSDNITFCSFVCTLKIQKNIVMLFIFNELFYIELTLIYNL